MNIDQEITKSIKKLFKLALENNIKITSTESCTGGLLSSLITEISGSSAIFDCGFVTYSNNSKNLLLEVRNNSLETFGAVSKEVAEEMAIGAIKKSQANLSVAITGIAGPNSDSTNKKVGLVFISSFNKVSNQLITKKFEFDGNREFIRKSSVLSAINLLIKQISNEMD